MMKFSGGLSAGLGSLKNFFSNYSELFGIRPAVLISGEKSFKIAGRTVEKVLQENGVSVNVVTEDVAATLSSIENIYNIILKMNLTNPVIVAVGGGTAIDVSKAISSMFDSELIVVPTLLSSDAIASGYSVIWKDNKNTAIPTRPPSLIIGDYDILKQEPKRFVAAGFGDMLSKVSALYDWRLSFWLGGETYNDFAMNIAESTVDLLKKRAKDIRDMNYIGIETLFLAEVTDGYLMELSGSTRVAAGSEHLFAFALETLESTGMHGELCSLGTIMMSYLQSREKANIRDFLETVGTPTNAGEMNIDSKSIIKALTMAHKMRAWYTILGPNGISEGSAERLARYTHVIE